MDIYLGPLDNHLGPLDIHSDALNFQLRLLDIHFGPLDIHLETGGQFVVFGWLLGASRWPHQCHLGLLNVSLRPLGSLFVPVNGPLEPQNSHMGLLASYWGLLAHWTPFDKYLKATI